MWWLDKNKPEDLKAVEGRGLREPEWPMWVNGLLGRAMVGYYAGSGDKRILKTLETAYSGSRDWVGLGWAMSNPWPAFETYTWTGNKVIKEALTALFAQRAPTNKKAVVLGSLPPPPSDKPGAEAPDHGVHFCESTAPWALGYLWTGKREFLDAPLRMARHDRTRLHAAARRARVRRILGPHRRVSRHRNLRRGGLYVEPKPAAEHQRARPTGRSDRAGVLQCRPGDASPAISRRTSIFNRPTAWPTSRCPPPDMFTFKRKHVPLCCTAALNRILPNYVINMWMATRDNGLAAVCYGPCKVSALVADRVPVELDVQDRLSVQRDDRNHGQPGARSDVPALVPHSRLVQECRD